MTPIRTLKESQLREYRRLIEKHGKAGALAIFKRDLILRMGNAWWNEHRSAVLDELKKEEQK